MILYKDNKQVEVEKLESGHNYILHVKIKIVCN